nr:xanthine dehydrogenase family protein subunit M [Sulfobacillus harzensis]
MLKELEYVRPETVDEAVYLLNTLTDAGILAGGQSLVNVLKLRIGGYSTLVDISRLSELKEIEVSDEDVHIGAGVTYDELIRSPEVAMARPILPAVATRIADQQVRNRGTVGGNCCYNDPTCHFPPILTALGATFIIRGPGGEREVAAEDFFVSYYQTAIEHGEILTTIRVPRQRPGQGDGFAPLSAGGTDVLNIITGASSVQLSASGKVEDLRLVVTGAGERPMRLASVEKSLLGTDGESTALDTAFDALDVAMFEPPEDVHASAEYRRAMVPVFARRAVEQALSNARRGLNE